MAATLKVYALRALNAVLAIALLGSTPVGCATKPYNMLPPAVNSDGTPVEGVEPQFERGEPYALVDALGFIFSLPSKLLLWSWSVENHDVSPQTEAALARYLKENDLRKTKVRINQYSPGDEWSRLVDNEEVGAGWRYTLGVVSWLFYTILPGRVFGGDSFNPFTNTISIYSDNQAIALHEGGHAKDDALTEYKGTYAALRLIPLVPLFQEAEATSDALSYYQNYKCREKEKDAYKILYPAYATYIGGELAIWIPGADLITLIAVIPGHIAGRYQASEVKTEDDTFACNPPGENPPGTEDEAAPADAAPAEGAQADEQPVQEPAAEPAAEEPPMDEIPLDETPPPSPAVEARMEPAASILN